MNKNIEEINKKDSINLSEEEIKNKLKADFLKFLNENKKDLATGFGAFHTDNHSNW